MRCSPPHYVARPLADSLDAPVGGLLALSAILPVCALDAHARLCLLSIQLYLDCVSEHMRVFFLFKSMF